MGVTVYYIGGGKITCKTLTCGCFECELPNHPDRHQNTVHQISPDIDFDEWRSRVDDERRMYCGPEITKSKRRHYEEYYFPADFDYHIDDDGYWDCYDERDSYD